MRAEPFDKLRTALVEAHRRRPLTGSGRGICRVDTGEDALNGRAERAIRRPRSKQVTDAGLDVPSYGRRYCRGSPEWSGGAEQLAGR